MIKLYIVDAFAEHTFQGNPAGVCPLDAWISDDLMQNIAFENNLSETAFFVARPDSNHEFDIRWFTPTKEIDLCGHATLASAKVFFDSLQEAQEIQEKQETESSVNEVIFHCGLGRLPVKLLENGQLQLNFPASHLQQASESERQAVGSALGQLPKLLYKSDDYLAIYESQTDILNIKPDMNALMTFDLRGVCVTARGDEVDFVSRFFAPKFGIVEDPVTGSAHTFLAPYWSGVLGKDQLSAKQVSARVGTLFCECVVEEGEARVLISGQAIVFSVGQIVANLI